MLTNITALASAGVALAAALLALVGVMRTIRQKDRTDRRDQWWKRVQWAADLARADDDAAQQVGMAALLALIEGPSEIEEADGQLLQSIIDVVLDSVEHAADGSSASWQDEALREREGTAGEQSA